MIYSNKDLARKLEELEKRYDSKFRVIFDTLKELMNPLQAEKKDIGFKVKEPKLKYN
jgi:hypothetical protein